MKLSEFLNLEIKEQKESIKRYHLIELNNEDEFLQIFKKTLEFLNDDGIINVERIKSFEKDILQNISAIAIYSGRIMNANSSANALNHYVGNAKYISLMKCLTRNYLLKNQYISFYELSIKRKEVFDGICEKIGFSNEFVESFENATYLNSERYKTENVDPTIKQIYIPSVNGGYNIIGIINSARLTHKLSQEIWDLKRAEIKERSVSSINIPVGGTQPQNAGEIINSFAGQVITFFSKPPSKMITNKDFLNFANLEKIEKTGNIFSILKNKRFYINSKELNKGKDTSSFLYSINRYEYSPENMKTESGLYEACFYLLEDYLSVLEDFQNDIVSQLEKEDVFFDNISTEMKKFIAPWIFKASIDADEYRKLSESFLKEVLKKLTLKKDKDSYLLSDRVIKNLKKASIELLRSF